ncbi:MAG: VCBS repeat domain-containing M23 family metallopeptidase [Chloroflexi bacterium]|nr:VCBS repeat domain-containing M23 family metallopeptidase [Chloroflexota bacterium]
MRQRRRMGMTIAAVGIIAAVTAGLVIGLPAIQRNRDISEISDVVKAEAAVFGAQSVDPTVVIPEPIVSDVVVSGPWSFGLLVTRAPEGIHAEPDLKLFITRRDEATGEISAAIEYTPTFYAYVEQIPDGLMPQAARDLLIEAAQVARGEAAAPGLLFALPWESGQTWTMTGGPHPDSGVGSARPWSALDFAWGPGVGLVRAAESGVVWRSTDCPNFIRIDHAGGYRTGYYHLVNERVQNGQNVLRGDAIGNEGMGVGCGGYTTGPHVHFSLRYYDSRLNIGGTELSGWVVRDGDRTYSGCMRRISDGYEVCTPYAAVLHGEGALPVISDLRYDWNRDTRADLWVVDLRPDDGGTVVLTVYDGSGPTSTLPVPRSSLPPQPEALNTSFAAGDHDGDGTPDLWIVHRRLDSSGTTALRILSGANPQSLIEDSPTALGYLGDEARFAVADYDRDGSPDLYAIVPDYIADTVRVRVVNGLDPMSIIGDRTAIIEAPSDYADVSFALADYDRDGRADLWVIEPHARADGKTRVTVLGGNNFQTVLEQDALPLAPQRTDINRFSWIVTDYNRDGTPDVWHVDRKSGVLTIVSGKNMTSILYDGPTGISKVHKLDYQILGSDRARLPIPPEPPQLIGPNDGKVVTDASVELSYRPSGLAKTTNLVMSDALGGVLASGKAPKAHTTACANDTCVVNTAEFGLQMRDGVRVYWNVRAGNTFGTTFSVTRSFVPDLPGPVDILLPEDGQALAVQPQFTWTSRPTASEYVVVVKNTATKEKVKLTFDHAQCTAACTAQLPSPLVDGPYSVKVKSHDAFGGMSKSVKHTFTLALAPPTATPIVSNTPAPTPTITPTLDPNATLPVPGYPQGFRGLDPTPEGTD